MTKTITAPTSIVFSTFKLLFLAALIGCSQSPWIQSDGHAVDPKEQLKCAQQVQQQTKGIIVSQKTLEGQIEQCLLDKGYQRAWEINTAPLSPS